MKDHLVFLKLVLSWDCALELEHMNPEWLVIVGQHTTVKPYPILVLIAHHTTRILRGLRRACKAMGLTSFEHSEKAFVSAPTLSGIIVVKL